MNYFLHPWLITCIYRYAMADRERSHSTRPVRMTTWRDELRNYFTHHSLSIYITHYTCKSINVINFIQMGGGQVWCFPCKSFKSRKDNCTIWCSCSLCIQIPDKLLTANYTEIYAYETHGFRFSTDQPKIHKRSPKCFRTSPSIIQR